MIQYILALFLLLSPMLVLSQSDDRVDLARMEKIHSEKLLSGVSDSLYVLSGSDFDVNYYRCHWFIDPSVRYVKGSVTVHFTALSTLSSIVLDLVDNMNVDSIVSKGRALAFTHAGQALKIQLVQSLLQAQHDSVVIHYQGVPLSDGSDYFHQGMHSGVPVIWTLSEPYGSRTWWPCKNGLNDKADSIDIIITAPAQYVASSNGWKLSEALIGNNKETRFKHRYPIASYLVAIAVTNYTTDADTVNANGGITPLFLYAYPESRNNFLKTMADVKRAFHTFSRLFGPYPFIGEPYSQTVFGWAGGMEHQTNSFIGSTWNQLIAHELAHQWFGNKVTTGSWSDVWLNEGYASYCQYLFIYDHQRFFARTYLEEQLNAITSQPAGSVYVRDTQDVDRIFSSRLSYGKAQYVLHMLRWVIGDSAFFAATNNYLNDPVLRYNFATTADLQSHMEAASNKNLDSFFLKWIYGEGYPNYHLDWRTNDNGWTWFQLRQTTTHPSVSFYEMPVALRFTGEGRDTVFVVDHGVNNQEYWIQTGFEPDSIIIDPDLWILSGIKTTRKLQTDSITSNAISVYPNPSSGNIILQVRNPDGNRLLVRVINMSGQQVFRRTYNTPGRDESIPIYLGKVSKGIYIIDISSDKNLRHRKKIFLH